jgi:sugar O-acyltransferase (sialic acid O-acetyltransferase NeuD family)
MRILILGAGAHAQTIADVLLYLHETGSPMVPLGFLDDDPDLAGTAPFGLPILGPLAAFTAIPHDALIVGIGRNATRKLVYERFHAAGARFVTVRHPTAVVARDVIVGPGTYIGPTAVVSVATRIGANCIINGTSCLGHHNVVGDHAHIAPGVHTTGHVTIGEGAQVGVGASIHPRPTRRRLEHRRRRRRGHPAGARWCRGGRRARPTVAAQPTPRGRGASDGARPSRGSADLT